MIEEPTLQATQDGFRWGPHVVHYIGHAGLNNGQGNLILHDENRLTVWLPPAQAADMLPLTTRLLCLSTCVTRPNYQIRGLTRMAQAPVEVELPTTVATQFQLDYPAARALWTAFYRLLLTGGDAGEAAHAARAEVARQTPRYSDWASLTLVVRDGTARPFRIPSGSRHVPKEAPGEDVEQLALEIRAQFAARLANDLADRLAALGEGAPEDLKRQADLEAERADRVRQSANPTDQPRGSAGAGA